MKVGVVSLSAISEMGGILDAPLLLRHPNDPENTAWDREKLASLRERGMIKILQGDDIDPHVQPWVVYLLRCKDNSYYVGSTTDLDRRLTEHEAGKGARYTKGRRPLVLCAGWIVHGRSAAQAIEAMIKKLPRGHKERVERGEISLETEICRRLKMNKVHAS